MSYSEDRQKWLANIKVGDVVGVSRSPSTPSLNKVDRLTATQIIIGNMRYSKKDGYAIGSYRFSRPFLTEITDSIREQVELRDLRSWASMRNWNASTIDQLRAMKKAHDEAATGQCLKGEE